MKRSDWLTRMDAAVDAALSAGCTEAALEHLHRAGIYSVRARVCSEAEGASADEKG